MFLRLPVSRPSTEDDEQNTDASSVSVCLESVLVAFKGGRKERGKKGKRNSVHVSGCTATALPPFKFRWRQQELTASRAGSKSTRQLIEEPSDGSLIEKRKNKTSPSLRP